MTLSLTNYIILDRRLAPPQSSSTDLSLLLVVVGVEFGRAGPEYTRTGERGNATVWHALAQRRERYFARSSSLTSYYRPENLVLGHELGRVDPAPHQLTAARGSVGSALNLGSWPYYGSTGEECRSGPTFPLPCGGVGKRGMTSTLPLPLPPVAGW